MWCWVLCHTTGFEYNLKIIPHFKLEPDPRCTQNHKVFIKIELVKSKKVGKKIYPTQKLMNFNFENIFYTLELKGLPFYKKKL